MGETRERKIRVERDDTRNQSQESLRIAHGASDQASDGAGYGPVSCCVCCRHTAVSADGKNDEEVAASGTTEKLNGACLIMYLSKLFSKLSFGKECVYG